MQAKPRITSDLCGNYHVKTADGRTVLITTSYVEALAKWAELV